MKKFIGIILIIGLILSLAPLSKPANAAAVQISVSGITNHNGAPMAPGAYVEVLDNGSPSPVTGTINPAGTFQGAASIAAGHNVSIRVWETWDGNGQPPNGSYYGTSAPETVGSGFVHIYTPAGFSTSDQISAGTLKFSSATYSVNEGAGTATITVTRTGGSNGTASVNYATSNGTATAGSDYIAKSGTLNWGNGDSANKTFTVSITNDPNDEPNETINLTLSGANGASLGAPNTAVLTIVDNDAAPIANISINPDSLNFSGDEGDGVLSKQSVTITNNGNAALVFTVSGAGAKDWLKVLPGGATVNQGAQVQLEAEVTLAGKPAGFSDSATITLQSGDAFDGESSFTVNVSVNDPDAPNITSITWQANENENYVYGTIEINGTNFLAAPGSVTIGGVSVPTGGNGMKIYQWTDTKITCGVPEEVTAGTNTVQVRNSNNLEGSSSIIVQSRIYGVNPTSAQAGEQITINGSGFGTNAGNITVTFDGTEGTQVSADNTTITVTVPDVNAGEVTLIVNVNGQTASTTFTVEETPVTPAPDITNAYNKELGTLESWVYVTPYDPNWQEGDPVDIALNLVVKGADFGEVEADGAASAPAGASIAVQPTNFSEYQTINDDPNTPPDRMYWWANDLIEIGIPEQIGETYVVAGPAKVKVTTDGGASNEQDFDIKANVYSLEPSSAMVSDEVTITGTAFGDNADNVSVTFNGNEAEIVSIDNGTIVVTVPQMDVTSEVEVVVTVNEVPTTYAQNFEVVDLTPVIGSLSATDGTAEVGQTIIISGENFGDEKVDTSMITFGTTPGNPTAWNDTSITVAVPQGAGTGEVELRIVTVNGEVSTNINIPGNNIYLDDFEGGSVGRWTQDLADSGYYTEGNNVSPDNDSISTDGPQAEAMYDGAKGMKVKFSHEATEEANLWGAKLANTLDLSAIKGISFYINWDDSSNAFDLILKDVDGKQATASVSNTSLMGVNGGGYGKLTIAVTNFAPELGFDWTKVTEYTVMYTTQATSESHHYVDNILAIVEGEDIETEVKIFSIDPAQAPAGTKVTIKGEDFGFAQGQSSLVFENIETNVSYQAEIEKWSASEIEAVVPELAGTGIYNVKVVKIAIAAGIINAQESNTETFKITANAAASGVANVYPNPFDPNNETLTIAYSPGSATNIGIYIYDMTARLVYKQTVSTSQTTWNGRDTWSKLLGDGAYILRVVNEDNKQLIAKGKILVIKQ